MQLLLPKEVLYMTAGVTFLPSGRLAPGAHLPSPEPQTQAVPTVPTATRAELQALNPRAGPWASVTIGKCPSAGFPQPCPGARRVSAIARSSDPPY